VALRGKVIGGGIACFMFYFLWSPPPKHKGFSDRDRLEATSRAMGGRSAPNKKAPASKKRGLSINFIQN